MWERKDAGAQRCGSVKMRERKDAGAQRCRNANKRECNEGGVQRSERKAEKIDQNRLANWHL